MEDNGFSLVSWEEPQWDARKFQLRRGNSHVEVTVYMDELQNYSHLASSHWKKAVFDGLCDLWWDTFHEKVYAIPPPQPGTMWTFTTEPPVVEGEIVEEQVTLGFDGANPSGGFVVGKIVTVDGATHVEMLDGTLVKPGSLGWLFKDHTVEGEEEGPKEIAQHPN